MPWRGPFVTDLKDQSDLLRRRSHGLIEVRAGEFQRIRLRRLPKLISVPEISLWGRWMHSRRAGDCCWLYYNQPVRCPGFLTVQYVISNSATSYATIRRAADVLDAIAEIKKTDAIVCQLSNPRISHRLLTRWGWERQQIGDKRRHYIKRFYGRYPTQAPQIDAGGVGCIGSISHAFDPGQPVLPCN